MRRALNCRHMRERRIDLRFIRQTPRQHRATPTTIVSHQLYLGRCKALAAANIAAGGDGFLTVAERLNEIPRAWGVPVDAKCQRARLNRLDRHLKKAGLIERKWGHIRPTQLPNGSKLIYFKLDKTPQNSLSEAPQTTSGKKVLYRREPQAIPPLDVETLRAADDAALTGPSPLAPSGSEEFLKPPQPTAAAHSNPVRRIYQETPVSEDASMDDPLSTVKCPELKARLLSLQAKMTANPRPEPVPERAQAPAHRPSAPKPETNVRPISKTPESYRQPDDHVEADATWLNMTLRGVPQLRGVFCGRQASKRYGRWVWRAAVAALIQEAPGRIQDPSAYVVRAADNLAKRKSPDVRRSADFYCQTGWGPQALAFAGVRLPDG